MDNIFLTDMFDGWIQKMPSKRLQTANKVLDKVGVYARLSTPVVTGSMTSIEQRMNIYHLTTAALFYGVPGAFVELGCYTGQTSVVLQKILDHYDPSRELHVYDSFEGLPEVEDRDETDFVKGQLATTKDELLANFEHCGLKPPTIHVGWFEDTLPDGLPEQIAFAHLDGDLYSSIMTSLEHVYPKLAKGGVCVIDDYCDPEVFDAYNPLPGVKKACDEFLADKPEKVSVMYGGYDSVRGYGTHGFFRKL